MKNKIKDSEKSLSRLINEAVRRSINEMYDDDYENVPLSVVFNVSAHDDLCREYIYNREGECVGRFGDLFIHYSPNANKPGYANSDL